MMPVVSASFAALQQNAFMRLCPFWQRATTWPVSPLHLPLVAAVACDYAAANVRALRPSQGKRLMPPANLLIRAMRPADLDAVVAVHQRAFVGFFLTRMGPAFLRGYYQTVIDFDGSIALVASLVDDPDNIVGFAVGFHDPHRFYALFGQRRRRLLSSMAMAILRDPGLIVQILRNVRRVGAQQEQLHPGVVELSSIGVAHAGGGIGGQLVEAFAVAASGARQILLTTDQEDNDAVRRFYERRGFILDGYEKRGERSLCRYYRTLS